MAAPSRAKAVRDVARRKIEFSGVEYEIYDSHAMRHDEGAGKYAVLNRVVDSLYVRVWSPHHPSSWLQGQLEEWREICKTWRPEPLVIRVPGLGHFELTRGDNPYEFGLYNERVAEVRIWRPENWDKTAVGNTGQFFVVFRSKFMQFVGIPGCQRFLSQLEGLMCSPEPLALPNMPQAYRKIARADLAIDFQMPDKLTWHDTDAFVSRAPRLKKDAFLTPFGDDIENVLRTVSDRTHKTMKEAKKRGVSHKEPRSDNKGGLLSMQTRNSFSGGSCDGASDDLGAALDFSTVDAPNEHTIAPVELVTAYALNSFAKFILEGSEREDYADVNRVIGSAKQVQTIYFGRFKSDLYGRYYNKLLEIAASDKLWLMEIWRRAGWTASVDVWRMEFSLSGDALRNWFSGETGEYIDLTEPNTFLESIPSVWDFLTRSWLRHTVPNPNESKRSRWEPSQWWQGVQSAWGKSEKMLRVKKLPSSDVESLMQVATSYAVSATAHSLQIGEEAPPLASAADRAQLTADQLEKAQAGFAAHVRARLEYATSQQFVSDLLDSRKRKSLGLEWLIEGIEGDAKAKRLQIGEFLENARAKFVAHLKSLEAWKDTDEFYPVLLEKSRRKGLDAISDRDYTALARSQQMKRGKGS